MKELKVNISLLFITVILLLNCNVFYLIENVNSDCILIVVILFVIHSFIITIKCKKQHKSYFTPNILFIVILVITSAIAANRSYNQSVWLGIRPQRMQLIWFFSYFALARLMSCNKLKFSKVEKIIYIIGILELFVFSAFWISKGKLSNIIHMPYDYRYSAIRLRGDVLVIIFLFILALNNYLQGKDKKKNLVILIVIYLFELFCVQTRLVIIALSIALITIFILWKKSLILVQ